MWITSSWKLFCYNYLIFNLFVLNIFLYVFFISNVAILLVNTQCILWFLLACICVYFNPYLISDLVVVIHKCVIFFYLRRNSNNLSLYKIANFHSNTVKFISGYIICYHMVHIFIYYANDIVYNHMFILVI